MDAMPLVAALAAGLTGSLHCAVMCGPLACVGGGGKLVPAVGWQLGRLLAYVGLGGLLGAGGGAALAGFAEALKPIFPFVMVAGLIITALDLTKRMRAPAPLAQIWRRLTQITAKFSPGARALTLGMATPLLPCGLVWGMGVSAIAAGSAATGAALMGTFAAGSLPALAVAQAQLKLWPTAGRMGDLLRRSVVLLAAAVILWRAIGDASNGAQPHCH
jgi:uncharacterized protein